MASNPVATSLPDPPSNASLLPPSSGSFLAVRSIIYKLRPEELITSTGHPPNTPLLRPKLGTPCGQRWHPKLSQLTGNWPKAISKTPYELLSQTHDFSRVRRERKRAPWERILPRRASVGADSTPGGIPASLALPLASGDATHGGPGGVSPTALGEGKSDPASLPSPAGFYNCSSEPRL